ncbi:hypothetical protein PVAND_015975 [Polypedilum vanderplanki]|uniref:Uncharacterized protein n=1 Tax=Polypedilum vanderplanki TaxID=319348 RepID=A0A9J6BE92_POLVA|nr:hypothetical protein PVAND_015975 [Polypedilum vanderplanki]
MSFTLGSQFNERSLVIVFDSTGSMSSDLAQVKIVAKKIVRELASQPHHLISNFILVEFNDPDISSAFVTTEASKLVERLDRIHVSGGGDCPEMALSGLERALSYAKSHSLVFLFSDADAKDIYKQNSVIETIKNKKIIFNAFLTGACERSSQQHLVYYNLAKYGLGQVFDVTKNSIERALSSFLTHLHPDYESLLTRNFEGPRVANFHTDNTMNKIEIKVTGRNPKVEIIDPNNQIVQMTKTLNLPNAIAGEINNSVKGKWTIKTNARTPYAVNVGAKTKVHFDFDVRSSGERSQVTIKKPAAIDELKNVVIVSENKDKSLFTKLHKLKLVNGNEFQTEPINLPESTYDILVEANDREGERLSRRIDTIVREVRDAGSDTIEAIEESELNLDCPTGRGAAVWSFNGQRLSNTGSQLHLSKLKDNQSGTYKCQVGSSTKTFKVIVVAKPKIEFTNSIKNINEGDDITLRCAYESNKDVQITWTDDKNNMILKGNQMLTFPFSNNILRRRYRCNVKTVDFETTTPVFSLGLKLGKGDDEFLNQVTDLILGEISVQDYQRNLLTSFFNEIRDKLKSIMVQNGCYNDEIDEHKNADELLQKISSECNESY